MAKIGVVIPPALFDSLFLPEDKVRLQSLGEVIFTESPKNLTTADACVLLKDCEVGIGSWNTPYPNAELMAGCPNLRLWEHVAGSVKHMFGPHLHGRDITIASCKSAIAECVAEMVLGEIILGIRRVFENALDNRRGPGGKPKSMKTMFGSTIGVIGASEVGRRVIRLVQAFPCRVLLYDPFVSEERAADLGVSLRRDLLTLCAESDVVTLHTPNLPETRHLLGAEQFQAMRDDAIVINTSRGDCLDESALIAELEKGRLTAYLDVSSPEPAAPDSPLRRLPNCFYTSHIAGPPAYNMGRQAVNDVEAFLNGGKPLCVVTEEMLAYIS